MCKLSVKWKILRQFLQRVWNSTLSASDEIVEFTNIVDLDEVAHHELPHQDLHCLSSGL